MARGELAEGWAYRTIEEQFGERVTDTWIDAWRDESRRLVEVDRETRKLCRDFRANTQKNYERAREFLLRHGLDAERWDSETHHAAFQMLPPIARALAAVVWEGQASGKRGIERGFVRSRENHMASTGRVLPRLSSTLEFLSYSFEQSDIPGMGFPFVRYGDPRVGVDGKLQQTKRLMNESEYFEVAASEFRKKGREVVEQWRRGFEEVPKRLKSELERAEHDKFLEWCRAFLVRIDEEPERVLAEMYPGRELPTVDVVSLPARVLAAIGSVLFPDDFPRRLPVDELKDKVEQHLGVNGALECEFGVGGLHKGSRGPSRESQFETFHPWGKAPLPYRRALIKLRRNEARNLKPTWMPWPGGYPDESRRLAAMYRTIVLIPPDGE
jgi:hypothetical protein